MFYEFVRVRDAAGTEYSVRAAGDGETVIDKPATYPDGRPLPPVYLAATATTETGQKADRKKESD